MHEETEGFSLIELLIVVAIILIIAHRYSEFAQGQDGGE